MAEGRSAALWGHTSAVLALVANVNRDPKGRAYTPADFNPHRTEKPAPMQKISVKDWIPMLLKAQPKGKR